GAGSSGQEGFLEAWRRSALAPGDNATLLLRLEVASAASRPLRLNRRDSPGAEESRQLAALLAAQLEAGSVPEDDRAPAVRHRPELPDSLDVHDAASVNAREAPRVQVRLQRRHRAAEDVSLSRRVDQHIVRRRLDPVDLL